MIASTVVGTVVGTAVGAAVGAVIGAIVESPPGYWAAIGAILGGGGSAVMVLFSGIFALILKNKTSRKLIFGDKNSMSPLSNSDSLIFASSEKIFS